MRFKLTFLLAFFIGLNSSLFAQNKDVKLPDNWYNLDPIQNSYFGISTEKAYSELLKNKKPKKQVIVAVIDGGIDIQHEDLKGIIWTNPKEIPGNGKDDDNNGYVDDVHGWNFIGSKRGDLAYDNLELVRIYRKYNPKYAATIKSTVLDSTEKLEYALYTKVSTEFGQKYDDADQNYRYLSIINKVLDSVAFVSNKKMPSLEDIERYTPNDEMEESAKKIIHSGSRKSGGFEKFYKDIKEAYKEYGNMIKYTLNPKYDERAALVEDNYNDSKERFYGNNDVTGPNADHGSHVSGIIGAVRNNAIGTNGISNQVIIMPIRVVPEGDERDKDVANGIRYAVDNGARIISMSFGKGYKWDKVAVDEAVKYAEEKGVLLIHAAGNDNLNVDLEDNYPNKYFEGKELDAFREAVEKSKHFALPATPFNNKIGQYRKAPEKINLKGLEIKNARSIDSLRMLIPYAKNWIEVGASSYKDDEDLKTSFSNYGKYSVDVFAPGFMIKSTTAGSKYEEFDGTSMAAPMVSGLAALVLSYYPELTANELRDIIIRSVVKVPHKIKYKNKKEESVKALFSEICVSGGVVNVYNALKVASSYAPDKKIIK